VDFFDSVGGDDIKVLKRRFKGFVGVSRNGKLTIANGYKRLGFPVRFEEESQVDRLNKEAFSKASDRQGLSQRWQEALQKGNLMIEELKVPFPDSRGFGGVKRLYISKTIRNLIITLLIGIFYYLGYAFKIIGEFEHSGNGRGTAQALLFFFCLLGVIIYGRQTLKALSLLIRFRDISKDVNGIGQVILNSLIRVGALHSNTADMEVMSTIDDSGAVFCRVEGGSNFDKAIFINCLKEVIEPVDNPRYILIRKSTALKFLHQQDFHAIPDILCRKRENAEKFARDWRHWVGRCTIQYTRNLEGRRFLLKARAESLASQIQEKPEPVKVWR
jgi:hypothetical protein